MTGEPGPVSTDQIAVMTYEPGGCECLDCGAIFIGQEDDSFCPSCSQNRAEAAYEHSLGECHRGAEAAATQADEQARIQRELK